MTLADDLAALARGVAERDRMAIDDRRTRQWLQLLAANIWECSQRARALQAGEVRQAPPADFGRPAGGAVVDLDTARRIRRGVE